MSFPNLSAWSVRERAITLFLIIALLVGGVFAFLKIGRAEDPAFTIKVLTVAVVWPGATAEKMQELVADPLEKRLQELQYYDRVETFTRPGMALMTLFLKDSTPPSDVQSEFYQARKKLGDETHNLPAGVYGPFINDEYSDVSFAVYAVKGKNLPPRVLTRYSEDLRERLLHVAGVKKVQILGERPEKIFVDFNYARLAELGVNPGDVFESLSRQNKLTPAGSIDTEGPQVFVRVDGEFTDEETVANTPVSSQGKTFKLRDIAEIKRGYEDPATFLIRNDGEPCMVLSVVMKDGWNGLTLGKALDNFERDVKANLPATVSFTKICDQAVNIRESVNEFMLKFFVALGVIMIVSLVSLGWRVGIVVATAVPLTLAGVLAIMMLTGRVFDRITLGAMIIALGLLVDDAIIAIEIMVVKLHEGVDRTRAAAHAWTSTAAPMLAGTLVTIIGFVPVGFARSTAGEYAGNIFGIVGFALLISWFVAVLFTPYLGVKMLPHIKPTPGGHEAIYNTPRFQRLRKVVMWTVNHKFKVLFTVIGIFLMAGLGMTLVKKQFFPNSDRPEVLVEVQMPEGSSIEATSKATSEVEAWLKQQPEAKIVTAYIGQGAPRFFFSYNPELPDPSFAKILVLTPDATQRDALKNRLRQAAANGLASAARVRASQLVFGPYSHFPVTFRVMGPDLKVAHDLALQVEQIARSNPHAQTVHVDWGELQSTMKLEFNKERLEAIGISPEEVSQQLQFLLNGVTITQMREDVRTVDVVVRGLGEERLNPSRLGDFTLKTRDGKPVSLAQLVQVKNGTEEPIMRRRDRIPTFTVECDIDDRLQPPQVSTEINQSLKPLMSRLPQGYRIEMGGNIEDSAKANVALVPWFPIMILMTLFVIVVQTRSLSSMWLVFLTSPLGLIGTVPTLLLFHQAFGFNAILGLIGLSGILMRNTLILIGQIHTNQEAGLTPYDSVVEATVQRARPVLLTAIAAVLAFMPLTHSVFWGAMAYTLIGGTAVGTFITLFFLPALYSIWFKIKPQTSKS
jgi:multidrug efflux pump subunit AcrB